jgi:hypothetical protein
MKVTRVSAKRPAAWPARQRWPNRAAQAPKVVRPTPGKPVKLKVIGKK